MSFKFTKSNLNFDVYTVASKPTTPGANNDIAIITSVPMPNWIMSPDKPSGIPRSDGDVWIQYSVSGNTFNALNNNSMMIATIKAWQYVDGAWTKVEAVSCQDGEWVEWWSGQLFTNGNQWEYVTGGWTTDGYRYTHSTGYTQESAEIGDTIKVSVKPGNATNGWTCVIAGTRNLIDLTDVSFIKCRATDVNTAFLCVHDNKTYAEISALQRASIVNGVTSLDVSSISGERYVFVHVHCGGDVRGVTVSEIWME